MIRPSIRFTSLSSNCGAMGSGSGRFQESLQKSSHDLAFAGKRRLSYAPPATCRTGARQGSARRLRGSRAKPTCSKATVWERSDADDSVGTLHYEVGAVGRKARGRAQVGCPLEDDGGLYYRSAGWTGRNPRSVDPALAAHEASIRFPGSSRRCSPPCRVARHNGMRLKLPHATLSGTKKSAWSRKRMLPCRPCRRSRTTFTCWISRHSRSSPEAGRSLRRNSNTGVFSHSPADALDRRSAQLQRRNISSTIAALSALLPAGELLHWQNGHGDQNPCRSHRRRREDRWAVLARATICRWANALYCAGAGLDWPRYRQCDCEALAAALQHKGADACTGWVFRART